MTLEQIALILAGWALKSSLLRGNGEPADRLGSAICLFFALALLYWGLSR